MILYYNRALRKKTKQNWVCNCNSQLSGCAVWVSGFLPTAWVCNCNSQLSGCAVWVNGFLPTAWVCNCNSQLSGCAVWVSGFLPTAWALGLCSSFTLPVGQGIPCSWNTLGPGTYCSATFRPDHPTLGEGNGTPLQYSCLEKSHGWRSLEGCSPWGC